MNQSKFTSGPWKKGFFKKNGEITALGIFENSATDGEMVNAICLVTPIESASQIDNHNAALIAAAPEMYESVQNLLGAFDTPIMKRRLTEFQSEAIKQAKQALAKARGEVNQPSGEKS